MINQRRLPTYIKGDSQNLVLLNLAVFITGKSEKLHSRIELVPCFLKRKFGLVCSIRWHFRKYLESGSIEDIITERLQWSDGTLDLHACYWILPSIIADKSNHFFLNASFNFVRNLQSSFRESIDIDRLRSRKSSLQNLSSTTEFGSFCGLLYSTVSTISFGSVFFSNLLRDL